jgi:type II restriction enzyme
LKLELNPAVATTFKSPSRRAGIITEKWGKENLYCLACSSNSLVPTSTGRPVIDFTCSNCGERYQLKSKKHSFGVSVANSAYEPKIKAIRNGTIPNFIFLQYDSTAWIVRNLFVVPKHFISESIIKRRKPLQKSARRAGWVGSEILLGSLPLDARVSIVKDGHELPNTRVRDLWSQFLFLRKQPVDSRGWLADVLACVRELEKETFTLTDVYKFDNKLAKLHPQNKNIRPKIRQQLQILRDNDVVEFLGKGKYKIKKL